MNDYATLWDTLGLGHPAPTVGARLVSSSTKPHAMRCIYYSEFKAAYYVRVRHKGVRMQRGFFETPEDATGIRDELEAKLGKIV